MKAKELVPTDRPRNFVAKNATKTTSGAGAHKDKKRADKQGDVKHKAKQFEQGVAETALRDKEDLVAKRQALQDLSRNPSVDQKAVQQRLLDLEKEARVKGLAERSEQREFKVYGHEYLSDLDQEDDNQKIRHMIKTPAGETISPDFTPYSYMSEEDVELFIKLGMPKRQSSAPLNSNDLHRMAVIKGVAMLDPKMARAGKANVDMRADDVDSARTVEAASSDFGQPREILENVLRILEREVEWPLTEIMEYNEVLRLLTPIKNAVNDRLKILEKEMDVPESDDWGSMSHKEFKRRELEHELAGEEEYDTPAAKDDWYLRIDGKVWKKGGEPVTFKGKESARKAGMTILRKNPGKKITVVDQPADRPSEISLESRLDELKRGTGFLILKFREKALPDGEGKYLIGYGGFGETPDDVRPVTAVIKEFKAETFDDMRKKIFDLFKDKSFVGIEKIKINAPMSLINKYPELEKLFSAAESGEFKKVEPIFSEPREIVSKKTEKYRIDPITGNRERIKEPIKYGRGMSGRPGEPGESTVRFSVTNPRLASMIKDQGMQFNQGKFTVTLSMYKKLLTALRDAEMIRKFGDATSLIKDKEIIENNETV